MAADRDQGITKLFDLCSYIGTIEMQQVLASNLRSEEVIPSATGPFPKRALYFLSLARMFLDEETFPAKEPLVPVTESDYVAVESWCKEHLGTVYPNMPWKSDREILNAYKEQRASMKKKKSEN